VKLEKIVDTKRVVKKEIPFINVINYKLLFTYTIYLIIYLIFSWN